MHQRSRSRRGFLLTHPDRGGPSPRLYAAMGVASVVGFAEGFWGVGVGGFFEPLGSVSV